MNHSGIQRGTFAQFGDSITVTMAFWAPLRYRRRNASPEMEEAFRLVNETMAPGCWSDWKGPDYGSDGSRTIRWAREHIGEWLRRLQPETALIMFGTNDLYDLSADEYASHLRAVVDACLDFGTRVLLNTIPPRSGYVESSAEFAEAARRVAGERGLPLVDYHAEILRRRPTDWDGSLDRFREWSGYDVPTLISRDGVHPSHPAAYRDDYSEAALDSNGYSLRNYLVLMAYADMLREGVRRPMGRAAPMRHLPWFPVAPPLPPPTGDVVRVSTVQELMRAIDGAKPRSTILVADGHYLLPRYVEIRADGVTLRGESGHRENVILDGIESQHGELLGIRACSDVTIADLTVQNIKWNGIKINSDSNVQRIVIRNCVIHNIWQRGVKGVKVVPERRANESPRGCRVEFCLFYNDRAKRYEDDPADTAENFGGNYIGGIDTMFAKEWVIADNVFIGIQGRTRGARGAIFLWHETEGCIVERNIIVDCDTGIALGNSHIPDDVAVHCTGVLVRNNLVTRPPENGIVADYTRDCRIVHNTIHDPENRLQRLIRLVHANDGLVVANNLLSGPPMRVETSSDVTFDGNLTQVVTDAFVSAEEGNLRLGRALDASAQVARRDDVPEDIDRAARSEATDPGADEFRAH
ncbi:hypothetical protein FJZ36_13130 [Candidatus Poribacteria bacterium]|nr:hypothetical protein [Candidatus Poribacteria bacterium]